MKRPYVTIRHVFRHTHCAFLISSYRRWKFRATISHTSSRSPESVRAMKDCTSAGWREPTTGRLWSTKPKPGWRWTSQPGPDGPRHPNPRRAPHCTWRTRSQERPAHLWAQTAWILTRGWFPPPVLTQAQIQPNTNPPQVRSRGPYQQQCFHSHSFYQIWPSDAALSRNYWLLTY